MSSEDTFRKVAEALAEEEERRELALAESRKIIRLSKNAIHAIHVGEDPSGYLTEMEKRIDSLVSDSPVSGPVNDAMMEYAEAELLYDVIRGHELRGTSELGITPEAWVLGLADTIGEIRRVIVTKLMEGDTERAKALFAAMEAIAEELMLFDVPDAVCPVRRKQDVARGIVDKTRSDLLSAELRRN